MYSSVAVLHQPVVARMARVLEARPEPGDGEYRFAGSYSPYHDRRVRHTRRLRMVADRLEVRDEVAGEPGAGPVRSYLHYHPSLSLVAVEDAAVVLAGADGTRIRVDWWGADRVLTGRGPGDPKGWYFHGFSRGEASPVVVGERDSPGGHSTATVYADLLNC
jgi:hypothetical protein